MSGVTYDPPLHTPAEELAALQAHMVETQAPWPPQWIVARVVAARNLIQAGPETPLRGPGECTPPPVPGADGRSKPQ